MNNLLLVKRKSWIRIRTEENCWVRIRIELNADPKTLV